MTLLRLMSRRYGKWEGWRHKTVPNSVAHFCQVNCCRIEPNFLLFAIKAKCVEIVFTDSSKNSCIPFMVDNKIVGTVPPNVVKELKNYPDVFEISGQNEATRAECVMLASRLSSVEQRDEAIARVLEEIRKKDNFVTLKGWRHEVHIIIGFRELVL